MGSQIARVSKMRLMRCGTSMMFKKQAYMIALNTAKPVAYICSFESTTCPYEREEKLNKTFCYEGNIAMAWLV